MNQPIVTFELDEDDHWRAVLACGHKQHVRHQPPLVSRPWTQTPEGRAKMIGTPLNCLHCDSQSSIPEIASGRARLPPSR